MNEHGAFIIIHDGHKNKSQSSISSVIRRFYEKNLKIFTVFFMSIEQSCSTEQVGCVPSARMPEWLALHPK